MTITTLTSRCSRARKNRIAQVLLPFLSVILFLLMTFNTQSAQAQFTIALDETSFGIANTFNNITQFDIEISVAQPLVAGGVYNNPVINQVDYSVFGTLPNATPSGFSAFQLVRSLTGTDFYAQSPESSLQFSIQSTADLSDGLQLSELVGTGSATSFFFNAREFDQDPGRFHPPDFSLFADGTGVLQNANNQSVFPNPPPPFGSGTLVDVTFGEEYIADLTFSPSDVTLVTVPEPATSWVLAMGAAIFSTRRRRTR